MTWLDVVVVICSERERFYIVVQDFTQSACSHLCVEDVGNMGKEPANPCIPRGINYCTVAVPHTNYILLTGVVEGFCSIIYRCDQASASNGPWHVISCYPRDKRDLTYHLVFSGAIYHCVRRGPISNANKFGPVCMGRIYTVSPRTGSTILCV